MGTLGIKTDERVENVSFTKDTIVVDLKDGRTISVPLVWYPKLFKATQKQKEAWEISGGGYGIHWDEIDEDLSTEGLLRGASAPTKRKRVIKKVPISKRRSHPKVKIRS